MGRHRSVSERGPQAGAGANTASLDATIDAGFLLADDRDQILADAETRFADAMGAADS